MKKTQVTQVPEKAKKGLFRIIFSRTGIILLLILMQIGLVVGTTYYLEAYKDFIYGIFVLMRVVVRMIYIINDSGMPEYKNDVASICYSDAIDRNDFLYLRQNADRQRSSCAPDRRLLRLRQTSIWFRTRM